MTEATLDPRLTAEQAIAAIYRAAAGTASWDETLSLLCDHMGAFGAQMIGVDAGTGAARFSHVSARIPSEAEIAYLRTYHKVDPRVPLVLFRPPGYWLYDQDVFPDDVALSNPFYRDLLIPTTRGRYTAGAKLCQHGGEITYIAFLTSEPSGFGPSQREFIAQIGYHLQEAALIYQRTRRLGATAAVGEGLVHRMMRPTLVLASGGRIEIANRPGTDFLAGGNGLTAPRGVLTADDPATRRGLEAALAALFASNVGSVRQVLRIGGDSARPRFVLSLSLFVPTETMFAFGAQPRVMAIVHDLDEKGSPDPMLWEAAFDVTIAEAQVAVLLARGMSVKQIASSRGVGVATVRTQIRALMEKTGARRQVDLVTRLLAVTAVR